MRIQYMSDLHMELAENSRYIKHCSFPVTGEVLVLAGDTFYLKNKVPPLGDFWSWASENYRQVLVVPAPCHGYVIPLSLQKKASPTGKLFLCPETAKSLLFIVSLIKSPTIIAMIYHLSGHTAIDTDVLSRNETCLVGAEKEYHIGNVHGIAHSPCWLLNGI